MAQDWLLSRADINKLVKLKYYQAHYELISSANVSVIDSDANRLDLSFSGSYPVKVSSLRDFEVLREIRLEYSLMPRSFHLRH